MFVCGKPVEANRWNVIRIFDTKKIIVPRRLPMNGPTITTQYTSVTDRWKDRQTCLQTPSNRHSFIHCVGNSTSKALQTLVKADVFPEKLLYCLAQNDLWVNAITLLVGRHIEDNWQKA